MVNRVLGGNLDTSALLCSDQRLITRSGRKIRGYNIDSQREERYLCAKKYLYKIADFLCDIPVLFFFFSSFYLLSLFPSVYVLWCRWSSMSQLTR